MDSRDQSKDTARARLIAAFERLIPEAACLDRSRCLPNACATRKGRFILSVNAMPAIRETFAGFHMEEIELLHTVSGRKGRTARELIIC